MDEIKTDRLRLAASGVADHGKSAPDTSKAHALIRGDGTGSGDSEAHSLPFFRGMARAQCTVPVEIFVRHSTVPCHP